MEIIFTDGKDERFIALCRELDAHLNDLIGCDRQRTQYARYNTLEDIRDAALVLENGRAVACGAFKAYAPGTAEIKRVFAKPECRGRGYGRAVMDALERRALAQGFTRLILETGRILDAAVRMYQRLGYRPIANYGQYRCMAESICMEKILISESQ